MSYRVHSHVLPRRVKWSRAKRFPKLLEIVFPRIETTVRNTMGGEGEGSEIRPEEPEPKVVDATESDGDARPSDPGFDASDGDRDRPGAHHNNEGAPSGSSAGDEATGDSLRHRIRVPLRVPLRGGDGAAAGASELSAPADARSDGAAAENRGR